MTQPNNEQSLKSKLDQESYRKRKEEGKKGKKKQKGDGAVREENTTKK